MQASMETRRKDEGDSRTPKKVEKRPREPMTVIMIQHTPVGPMRYPQTWEGGKRVAPCGLRVIPGDKLITTGTTHSLALWPGYFPPNHAHTHQS